MSTASPTAFLLWAILSVLFLVFLVYHLWSYDHFRCVLWSAGRQPGAFKRVMTYSYLGSVPLFVVYSVATTVIKYKEGAPPASSPSVLPRVVLTPPPSRRAPASPRRSRRATPSLARVLARAHSTGFVVTPDARIIPRPVGAYSAAARAWVVPLNFVFSFAWALELCVLSLCLFFPPFFHSFIHSDAPFELAAACPYAIPVLSPFLSLLLFLLSYLGAGVSFPCTCLCLDIWRGPHADGGLDLSHSVTHLEELAFWLYLLHQHPDKDEWFASWEYRLWYCGSIVAILGMPLTALIARRHIDTIDAYIFLSGSSGSTCTTVAFLYVLWRFPGFIRHVKAEGADPAVVVRLATFFQLNLARVVFRFMFTLPLMVLALDGIIGTRHPVNNSLFWTDFLQMIAGIGCFVSTTITLLIFFPRSIVKEAGYKPKPSSTLPNSPKSPPITPPSLAGPFSPAPSNIHAQLVSPSGWDGESALDDTRNADAYQVYHGYREYADVDCEQSQAPPYADADAQLHQRHPFPHSLSSPQILSPVLPQSPPQIPVAIPPAVRHSAAGGRGWAHAPGPRQGQGAGQPDISYLPQRHATAAQSPPSVSVLASMPQQSYRQGPRLHPYVMTFTSPIDLVDLSVQEDFPRTL
ncbi:hypothetical protein AcV5_002137 [Taiwanofungus camphoratus]|nr:hypothetical protein AcV5_002137 [Antrodia cinnamomea]